MLVMKQPRSSDTSMQLALAQHRIVMQQQQHP
jgi:hypothetical protein